MAQLYLVPTPIGNLKDITFRAIEVLNKVDIILCEDTRVSSRLLKTYEINKPLLSYHQHNEHKLTEKLVQRIKEGETMALISDAGSPAISDPGFLLVRSCIENEIEVESLAGPTAFVPALTNSGLPSEKFVFEGFLPPKKGRQTKLTQLSEEERTIIFYESPHRLLKTLKQLAEYFGADRAASVSRELSKMHEETVRGSIQELIVYYENNTLKGEIVLVVAGNKSKK